MTKRAAPSVHARNDGWNHLTINLQAQGQWISHILILTIPTTSAPCHKSSSCLSGTSNTGLRNGALAETILEAARHVLQVAHAASTSGHSSLALGGPVVRAHLGSGVSALGAGLLLLVVGTVAAALAESVGLCVALTKAGCTLGLKLKSQQKKYGKRW